MTDCAVSASDAHTKAPKHDRANYPVKQPCHRAKGRTKHQALHARCRTHTLEPLGDLSDVQLISSQLAAGRLTTHGPTCRHVARLCNTAMPSYIGAQTCSNMLDEPLGAC
ncbi:hypothetical protein J6590_098512 [Homalodisca vitripennis]|nr:hypothetical protein J6590_098512 [Homalodisca vitripennis]